MRRITFNCTNAMGLPVSCMKIFTAQQIQDWDAYTIAHEPITSIKLMERAALACTGFILSRYYGNTSFKIFCGKGNNGGDGLAIARLLIANGVPVSVYIIEFGARGTDDFQENLHRLHQVTTAIHFIQSAEFFPAIHAEDLVIDALFGSGLNRPLTGLSAQLVAHINQSKATIISIDVPSGLFLSKSSKGNPVIQAASTLSFQSYKLCFLVAENAPYFGEVFLLDIGLDQVYPSTVETDCKMVSAENIQSIYKPRKKFSHKGSFGHALLVAGNPGKMGAAVLAARACLRAGVGLLTCSLPEQSFSIVQTAVPEAMVINRQTTTDLNIYATVGIGPGLGVSPEATSTLQHILEQYKKNIVLDADALNILSQHTGWLQQVPPGSILTPHPKEFDRLFGNSINDFERIDKALRLSVQYPFTIVLKGHYTLIAANGKGLFNTTGNPGMATGGSGDILTGIITALVAQGYSSLQAAVLGVYLHGLAADLSLDAQSFESLLPSDITEHLGKAFLHIAVPKEKEVQE